MTFGYKITDSIHQTFGTALMVLSLENSSSAEGQALVHEPYRNFQMRAFSRNSSIDNARLLGLQKFSWYNLAVPGSISSAIRNAPSPPFTGSCSVPASAYEEGRLKRNLAFTAYVTLYWHHGFFCAQ